ncbi:MAG TPA: FAD-dependent oxidoreductase [Acidimicrobiales bacterium]|jgi:NADPH-dependent 2,4-dienoyl-CoA reductase/sulfur reductase-like enzyme|nr:FAD-dependent oxidoreductase [Acidimicrobiales bacterium]
MSPPLSPDSTVVVIGASLAGLRAAEEVRHEGHSGPVIVIGDERHVPYDRPPLSKQFLAGKWDVDRLHHHAPDKLDTLGIEFRLGRRADALDVDTRTVSLDDGTDLHYDGLIVATGARARSLPGTEGVPGVHTLRTLDDAEGLIADLAAAGPGARVVVIGAGFIGAEVAATCRGLGFEVTVVEALPTPLGRVLGDQMGAACAALHTDAGVALRTGVGVDRVVVQAPDLAAAATLDAAEDSARGTGPISVHLDDGEVLHADVVVVGIGVTPAVDWLAGSGLEVDNGLVCDEFLFAAPDVVAAGDVARWTHRGLNRSLRVEHWTNAAESGVAATRNLLHGRDAAEAYEPVLFFWSDQYATKIQLVGRPSPDDEVVIVDGSVEERKLVALYRDGDRLSGALAFSRPRQLMSYRPLLAAGASFDEALALARS